GGLVNLVGQNKQLQDELKLTKDQVEKLNDTLAKVRDDLKDELAKLRDPATSGEDRVAVMKKFTEESDRAAAKVPQPEQVKRLHQIENQQAGVGLFIREDVQKELKLTEDQEKKIREVNENLQKDIRELFAGFRPGARPDPDLPKKLQTAQKDALDNATKVLT